MITGLRLSNPASCSPTTATRDQRRSAPRRGRSHHHRRHRTRPGTRRRLLHDLPACTRPPRLKISPAVEYQRSRIQSAPPPPGAAKVNCRCDVAIYLREGRDTGGDRSMTGEERSAAVTCVEQADRDSLVGCAEGVTAARTGGRSRSRSCCRQDRPSLGVGHRSVDTAHRWAPRSRPRMCPDRAR